MLLRKAFLCDAAEMHGLMQPFIAEGVLLPRPLRLLCQNIRDFSVIEDEQGRLVAMAGLHFLDEDLAEIQSLAVSPACQHRGLGQRLVQHLLAEAEEHRVWKVLAMTHAPEFFERFGFTAGERRDVPQKFMRDCLTCSRLPSCHQRAMLCDVFARAQAKAAERAQASAIAGAQAGALVAIPA